MLAKARRLAFRTLRNGQAQVKHAGFLPRQVDELVKRRRSIRKDAQLVRKPSPGRIAQLSNGRPLFLWVLRNTQGLGLCKTIMTFMCPREPVIKLKQ